MHGKGVYRWSDGRSYEGEYYMDRKEGYGIYTWADGRTYTGYWKEGKQEGEGRYYVPQENKVQSGIWHNGKRVKWTNEQS